MPKDKVENANVMIVPSEVIKDAIEAKFEKLTDSGDDEYFAAFKAALNFVVTVIERHEVSIPTEVLPTRDED